MVPRYPALGGPLDIHSKTDLFTFHQNAAGGAVSSSYPLAELGFKNIGPISLKDVRAGLGYQFESVGIGGLSPFTTFQIAQIQGLYRRFPS